MAKPKKGGLGRGLGALISPKAVEAAPEVAGQPIAATQDDRILHLDPRGIAPNPSQPRVHFDEERLEELCESIRREGVIEPVRLDFYGA